MCRIPTYMCFESQHFIACFVIMYPRVCIFFDGDKRSCLTVYYFTHIS